VSLLDIASSRGDIALVHAHSPVICGLAALRAAGRLDVPVVYEVRGMWEQAIAEHARLRSLDLRYRVARALEMRVCHRANAVVAICEGLRRHLVGRGLPASRVQGMPNGVDTGAPGLVHLGDYLNRRSDPFNDHEPVDSSAAAIAAQGLLRLGRYFNTEKPGSGGKYLQAGLTVLETLLAEPYLSADPNHQGLLLHSIYHRPNGWDYIPEGRKSPCGEACMWGDYHLRELALYVQRLATGAPYLTFWA
jgi:hypothetical protein